MGQYQSSGQIKFPYKKGNLVWSRDSSDGYTFNLHEGSDNNNKPVSIISISPLKSNLASNFYRRVKSFKHPNVLNYINGTIVENEESYYIVTERVRPLSEVLNSLLEHPDSIAWGIYQISRAIVFFNKQKLVHGNINIENIFVNEQGDWQLGGFQFLSSVDDVKNDSSFLSSKEGRISSFNVQWPPEVVNNSLNDIQPYSIDSWLIGCFIYTLFNYKKTQNTQFDKSHLKNTKLIPASLKDEYIKLLSTSPRVRLSPDRFIESPYFQNEFVNTCVFLETLSIKDDAEKENFCKNLNKSVDNMPEMYTRKKLLPILVSSLDYGLLGSSSINLIIKLMKKDNNNPLNLELSSSVAKWFSFNDRVFRISLLENIETLIEYVDTKVVSESIWNHLIGGFTDVHPYLRELTIKSLVTFAPKLNSKILNNDALKFLAKLQSDKEPGIRTNTTICIGKLASFLNESTRKKILIPAFRTALKDTFPPSRKAGLNSFSHSHSLNYFTPGELAHIIIPLISPLTIDPDESIRDIALTSLNSYLLYLKEYSKSIPPNIQDESKKVDQDKGVFSWAISSLATKIIGSEDSQSKIITEQSKSNTGLQKTIDKSSSQNKVNDNQDKAKDQIKTINGQKEKTSIKEKKGYNLKEIQTNKHMNLIDDDVLFEQNDSDQNTNGWEEDDILQNVSFDSDLVKTGNKVSKEDEKAWSSRWDDDDDFDFDEPISKVVRRK